MKCQGCLKTSEKEFCPKCRKRLFDGRKVSGHLLFDSPYDGDSTFYTDHTQKISISGVQVKYSLKLEGNELQLTESGGQYILKPIPTGTFKNLGAAPANEHLTMQIAEQVYKFTSPATAIVFFKDGSHAYLVRRFDQRPEGGKYQQEDFAQIAQMTSESHGKNYKYDLSYQEIADLIRKYIPTHLIELEKFFRLVLFNYIFSNGDAHLKNFSAIQTTQGDHILTPIYDLLCTRIHAPTESDMALSLFKDDFTDAYMAYGFYTYQDFLTFGRQIGIKELRVEKIIQKFKINHELTGSIIEYSYLSEELKSDYMGIYLDKLIRLEMI